MDTNADPVTVSCSYDENGDATLWPTSAPWTLRARSIAWSLGGVDVADFEITGGVLSFKQVSQLRVADGYAGDWRNCRQQLRW